MYTKQCVECNEFQYLFKVEHPAVLVSDTQTKITFSSWQVCFIPIGSAWHYSILMLVKNKKDVWGWDFRETAAVENYRGIGYVYAERLLIDFLNERFH